MTIQDAFDHLFEITQDYFAGATVMYGMSGGTVRPPAPLVILSMLTPSRNLKPISGTAQGVPTQTYSSHVTVQVDLYTPGASADAPAGHLAPARNMALHDLMAFANHLGSPYISDRCYSLDMAVTLRAFPRDLTGLVNDASYEYRAMMELDLSYTEAVHGYAGLHDEAGHFEATSSGGGSAELAARGTGYFEDVHITELKE